MKRAVLISDLHLAVGPDHNVESFFSDGPFQHFLQGPLLNPAAGDQVELVLLGDTFDLWQTALDDAEYTAPSTADVPLDYTGADEVQRLQRIHVGHPGFFENLEAFAARPNCRLTIIPGNHDHTVVGAVPVQEAIRQRIGGGLSFGVHFDRPDLFLYAEHGNQWDRNNAYADFGQTGLAGECAGYFLVRLFWNRLKTLEPRLADYPTDWRKLWHFLMPILRSHPLALPKALRYWVQYRRDPRVSAPLQVEGLPFAVPAAPAAPGVVADGPDLLAAGVKSDGHVFALDPEIEHALRDAYYKQPAVKQAVDELRPAGAPPVPPAEPSLAAQAVPFAAVDALELEEGALALFSEKPTGRDEPLDPAKYRFVLFGHTHKVGEKELANGAWYINTGTWIGRHPPRLPVVVAEQNEQGVRVGLGRFDADRIEIDEDDWHRP
jgi:UDP-2,3-diacylglucosamine pyrophosphatase LpxH